ncbi:HAD-like domain-containing protein, partial [Gymnopilus junonius]
MNTIGYVARQFQQRQTEGQPRALQRVNSWSTKSLLFPPPPKRSHSAPSFPHQQPPEPPLPPRSKVNLESVIDGIFLIRVFLLVWDNLTSAWHSLLQHLYTPPPIPQPAVLSPTPPTSRSDSSPKKFPFHLPKTLVLDLDETLIHSTSRPIPYQGPHSGLFSRVPFGRSTNKSAGHMVEVVLGGRSTLYHVYKRPFVDYFLRTVSGWYTLVIFTASMKEYADPVIDWLDAGRGILEHRFFRDACLLDLSLFHSLLIFLFIPLPNGSYTKDLSLIEADLARVCLIDNSPVSYTVNEANGIPIEGWTHDPSDEALLDLLPVLDSLRFTSDVRRVLGLR